MVIYNNSYNIYHLLYGRIWTGEFDLLMSDILCQFEYVLLPASFSYSDKLFSKMIEEISNFENSKIKKIIITHSINRREKNYPSETFWIEDYSFARGICNLEFFKSNHKCNLTSKQENAIYRMIIDNSNISLKILDLRNSSIEIDLIDANCLSEAILKLYEYKNCVTVYQAEIILDNILCTKKFNLKRLLLYVKCESNDYFQFVYSKEKMNKIKEKLDLKLELIK